ncbi:adenylate/guanylate cyclase [Chryseobacterium sp. StRB126]|nr:adenylate/guanylate cyclase [Chryseobacterium sp. StRB126]
MVEKDFTGVKNFHSWALMKETKLKKRIEKYLYIIINFCKTSKSINSLYLKKYKPSNFDGLYHFECKNFS